MAIHKDNPGLTIKIMANGKPLREYGNASEKTGSDEVTKYIEAQSGVEFMIRYKLSRPFPIRKMLVAMSL